MEEKWLFLTGTQRGIKVRVPDFDTGLLPGKEKKNYQEPLFYSHSMFLNCTGKRASTSQCVCRGQSTVCMSWVSPSVMWVSIRKLGQVSLPTVPSQQPIITLIQVKILKQARTRTLGIYMWLTTQPKPACLQVSCPRFVYKIHFPPL